MDRVLTWYRRRDALLVVAAAAAGVAIAYVDSRPSWDDTGITVSLILLTAAIAAGVSRRRPWLWALLIGLPLPLLELWGPAGAASLVAPLLAFIGASAGYGIARVAQPGEA
jgi:hypothetical protein